MTTRTVGRSRPPRRSLPQRAAPMWGARALAGVAVGVGAWAILVRPVAPDVGPLPADTTWFDAATLARVDAYWAPLRPVQIAAAVLGALVPLGVAAAWRPGARARSWARRASGWPAWARVALVAVGVVAVQQVVLLAPRWWVGVVHAGDFGLRTQSWLGWVGDRTLATGVTLVTTAVAAAAVAAVVGRAPRAWPLLAAAAVAILSGLGVIAWPVLVEPLFVQVSELEAGPARSAVVATTQAAGWSEVPIVVADASRRTTRVNAHVSGFGATRRVVLHDTLLELPPEQVAAVVGHELAHHEHHDLLRGWLGSVGALSGLGLALDVWWRRHLDRAAAGGRGASSAALALTDRPRTVAVVVALTLAAQAVTLPAASWASRRAEASADATGLDLVADPSAAVALQTSLVERNLSDPSPPTWWLVWRASHPPAAQRLHRAGLAAR